MALLGGNALIIWIYIFFVGQGDSGGPLACYLGDRYELMGLVSWGRGCAEEHFPTVYTRVVNYLDFIANSTNGGSWRWWRHQMETFSTLLAIFAGNSPVTGEFPAQRPVTQSFDVFFDLRPNERLSKQ